MRPVLFTLNNIVVLLLALLFASCQKSGEDLNSSPLAQKDIQNENYGSDPAQIMDIYLPANRSADSTKIIFFVHGGSWASGDKSDFNDAIAAIRNQLPHFAIFNINYRLANGIQNLFPTQINDIDDAIDFITNNASSYFINPNKIVIVGASAGAHLALLKAYNDNPDNKIKAVIDLFGPTDLVWMYFNHPEPEYAQPLLINFLGYPATTHLALYQQASPINFVTAQSPPTEIFHGTADEVVPISQSDSLQSKLQLLNVKNEYTVYQGEAHGWTDSNLADTYNKAINFIENTVH